MSPTLYVVNGGDGTVTPIDTVTNKTGKPITVALPGYRDSPGEIMVTPNGRTGYVLDDDSETTSVTPVNTRSDESGARSRFGHGPSGMVISPGAS
jgi:YVTN family beta-propeller protein